MVSAATTGGRGNRYGRGVAMVMLAGVCLSSVGLLVRSIEAGGTDEYPALDEEDPARNVFSFSRRPDQEERLLQSLSRSDELPVRGWLAEPGGRWEEGFAGMRLDRAESLGIPTRPGAQA